MGMELLIENLLLLSRTCSWTHTSLVPNDQHDEESLSPNLLLLSRALSRALSSRATQSPCSWTPTRTHARALRTTKAHSTIIISDLTPFPRREMDPGRVGPVRLSCVSATSARCATAHRRSHSMSAANPLPSCRRVIASTYTESVLSAVTHSTGSVRHHFRYARYANLTAAAATVSIHSIE